MKKLELTPEELFFLGKKTDGKFLDYDFYAAIEESRKKEREAEWDYTDSLIRKGILRETLLGEPELEEDAHILLDALFNGEYRSSVSVYSPGKEIISESRFFWGDVCVSAYLTSEATVLISEVSLPELEEYVQSLMPDGYQDRDKPEEDLKLSNEDVKRILSFRSLNTENGETRVSLVADISNWLCKWDDEGNCCLMSPLQFFEEAMGILRKEG